VPSDARPLVLKKWKEGLRKEGDHRESICLSLAFKKERQESNRGSQESVRHVSLKRGGPTGQNRIRGKVQCAFKTILKVKDQRRGVGKGKRSSVTSKVFWKSSDIKKKGDDRERREEGEQHECSIR